MSDIQIYKDYLRAKTDPLLTVDMVAEKHHISREEMSQAIRKVRFGDSVMIRKELTKAGNEILWKYKYAPMVAVLPDVSRGKQNPELTRIIQAMKKDGFQELHIAEKLGKNRQTIRYHLKR